MPGLFALPSAEIAIDGQLEFEFDPGAVHPLEEVHLVERVTPFGGPPASWQPAGQITGPGTTSRNVGLGSLYEARLRRGPLPGAGGESGLLGVLHVPSLGSETRSDLLTRCTRVPQLLVSPQGTYVDVQVGSAARACVRVQVGTEPPMQEGPFPAFAQDALVGAGVSMQPGFMHDVRVVEEVGEGAPIGSLAPGQDLYFVVLAWTPQAWDYAWSVDSPAPGPATSFRMKSRTITVRVHELHCIDDGDDLSDGEATFEVTIGAGPSPLKKTIHWPDMATGDTLKVNITHVIADANSVPVIIRGEEDDSPFGPDVSEAAFTIRPPGGIAEVASGRNWIPSGPLNVENDFRFAADVSWSISYA